MPRAAHTDEEIVRALVPDEEPRFLTFVFGLPAQLPLPHGSTVWQHRKPGEIRDPRWSFSTHVPMGDAVTAEALPMSIPFVSLRFWQPKTSIRLAAGEAGLMQVVNVLFPPPSGQELPPLPDLSVSEESYRTVVEAVTQAAAAEGEPPTPNLVAGSFNRCLAAVNDVIDAYSVAANDAEIPHVTASHLGILAFAGSRPIYASHFDVGPVFYFLPARPWPAIDKPFVDQEGWDMTMRFLTVMAAGNPFVAAERYYLHATRAMASGDYGEVLVLTATSGEIGLNALLRSIVVEVEGPETARAIFERADRRTGLKTRLRREYEPRLRGGSNWNPDTPGRVGRWWKAVEAIRGRVVHGGYDPTPQEAHDALLASKDLDQFIDERLADRRYVFPITTLSKLGMPGLEKRGLWSRRLSRLAATLDLAGHWQTMAITLPADVGEVPEP